jgi:hypothetical protein
LATYDSNIVYNPSAATGFGLQAWTTTNASTSVGSSDLNDYHFLLNTDGSMKQNIPSARFNHVTPMDFNVEIDYWLDAATTSAKVLCYVQMDFLYEEDVIDTALFPCTGIPGRWHGIREICETLGEEKEDGSLRKLLSVDLSIINASTETRLRIDRITVQANTTSRDATQGDNPFENFTDKAILFGLDAAKPVLR